MAHKNIKTVAGCLTRVTCDITAPEGVDTTLTAFLVYEGESRPATLESADVIIFPAVPYGHYAYEIRCGGKPVAFGHLLVRPSAFPHTAGIVDYALAVDLSTTDAAQIAITFNPGPKGESGHLQPVDPATPGNLTLTPGHILDLGTLTVDTDLTALSFAESANVQTAELWFTTGATAPVITWPVDIVWADGNEPSLDTATAYRFALRREPNGRLIGNIAYIYAL